MSKDLKEENCKPMSISIVSTVFSFFNGNIEVLLCNESDNFEWYWTLPSSLLRKRENLDHGARRLVKELSGLDNINIEQVKTFGNLDRFVIEQKIEVGYLSLVDREYFSLTPSAVRSGAQWFGINDLPELRLEDKEIIMCCRQHLKEISILKPIVFNLLPQSFTFPELVKIYEEMLDVKLDKSNFRSKIRRLKILNELKEKRRGSSYRNASLFSFNPAAYKKLKLKGFPVE